MATGAQDDDGDLWTTTRLAVSLLVLMLATYYLVVAFDNITNPASNWAFVKGVMTLDGVAPDSGFAWRAIDNTAVQVAAYVSIIIGETLAGAALAIGAVKGVRRRAEAPAWARSQRVSIAGLTVALAVFLLGFIVIGGNWWVMYLNTKWNGLTPAFQNSALALFALVAIVAVAAAGRAEVPSDG